MNEDPHTQVDAFLDILYQRLGISETDLKHWIRVFPQIIDAHERSMRFAEFIARAFLGAGIAILVGGVFSVLGYAAWHFIREVTGG